jgi:hydrogenase expression/formation protein HypE
MGEKVLMGHGSGGQMMHRLVREVLAPAFSMKNLADAAIVDMPEEGRVALTTDSYVVSPIFFPGGNIGDLAVCGTINDLAVMGARPLYLTVGLILEEGLPLEDLRQVVASMAETATHAGVLIVAGDTKVVERGSCDGMYINTAGVGIVPSGTDLSAAHIRDGDAVVVSGPCGTHGMAIMAERNKLTFNPPLESDTAALNNLVESMLRASPGIKMMRDPTRGGLATTVKEIAQESEKRVVLQEEAIPVLPRVKGACDLLGLDPLYVANEGVVVAVVDPSHSQAVLDAMRSHPLGRGAAEIGYISGERDGRVLLETSAGGSRILEMLVGEQLPRIC